MESRKDTKPGGVEGAFSRRNLLKGAAGLAAVTTVPQVFAQQPTGAPFGTIWLYISTYTSAAPSAFGSNGQGIYLCQLDLSDGSLTVLRLVAPVVPATGTPRTASPSTIALDPTRTHLYAGNEYGPPGAVSAYSINRVTGDLTFQNIQPAMGSPAHVSVDHKGNYLFSAEYSGGWFEAFPINGDGSLGSAVFQVQDVGNVGPLIATNAPRGSFAISAHEGPNGHPHQMEADPSNQWVLGSDAGQDRIYVWKLGTGSTPPLTATAQAFVSTPPGDGPRHFAFHPNGTWLYSIQEEGNTIMFWRFNPATGVLTAEQTIPSVPPGFAGTDFTSEIRVSPDGRYVYGANRTNDTIGVFRINGSGRLTQVSHVSTMGDYPRIFTIDPLGLFMVVANQRADNVTTFRITHQTDGTGVGPGRLDGSLVFTGNYTPVGSPSGMVFLY